MAVLTVLSENDVGVGWLDVPNASTQNMLMKL